MKLNRIFPELGARQKLQIFECSDCIEFTTPNRRNSSNTLSNWGAGDAHAATKLAESPSLRGLLKREIYMYSHVLIPTDGSDLSKMAIQEGVALAKALDARVTAVTVTMPFHIFAIELGMITDTPEQYKKRMAGIAATYLDVAMTTAAAADVVCDVVHVEHEQIYRGIIDTAQKQGCDVILMASHGRRGIAGIVLGSETVKVLTHSSIPVIVCRRPHPAGFQYAR